MHELHLYHVIVCTNLYIYFYEYFNTPQTGQNTKRRLKVIFFKSSF